MQARPGHVPRIGAIVVAVVSIFSSSLACAADDMERIVWSPDRPLGRSDFRGSPPPGSELSALSSWTIEVAGLRCGPDGTLHGRARAVFLPDRSWVRARPSDALLEHEQGHFDLAEVFARELDERLRQEGERICRSTGAKGAQRLYDDVLDAAERESARYDAETDRGRRPEAQRRWRRTITAALAP